MNYLDSLKMMGLFHQEHIRFLKFLSSHQKQKKLKDQDHFKKTKCKLSTIVDLFLQSDLCVWLFNRESTRCYHKATTKTYRFLPLPCYQTLPLDLINQVKRGTSHPPMPQKERKKSREGGSHIRVAPKLSSLVYIFSTITMKICVHF